MSNTTIKDFDVLDGIWCCSDGWCPVMSSCVRGFCVVSGGVLWCQGVSFGVWCCFVVSGGVRGCLLMSGDV